MEKERTDLDRETWKQVERLRATRNAVDEYVYLHCFDTFHSMRKGQQRDTHYIQLVKVISERA